MEKKPYSSFDNTEPKEEKTAYKRVVGIFCIAVAVIFTAAAAVIMGFLIGTQSTQNETLYKLALTPVLFVSLVAVAFSTVFSFFCSSFTLGKVSLLVNIAGIICTVVSFIIIYN